LFRGARVDNLVGYGPNDRRCRGHGHEHEVYQQFELHWGEGRQKMRVYSELLRAFMADQAAWIRDRNHARKITEQNGRDSVAMACAATRLAHQS
jgi:hypothetical protein